MYEQRFVNILSINDEGQNCVSPPQDRKSKAPQDGQMARDFRQGQGTQKEHQKWWHASGGHRRALGRPEGRQHRPRPEKTGGYAAFRSGVACRPGYHRANVKRHSPFRLGRELRVGGERPPGSSASAASSRTACSPPDSRGSCQFSLMMRIWVVRRVLFLNRKKNVP
jgi:hypothetical protein